MALIDCPECEHKVSGKAISCPSCGNPMSKYVDAQGNPRQPYGWEIREAAKQASLGDGAPIANVASSQKSMVVGLLLTFFFGSLGLLYTNVKAGLILTALTILLAIPSLGLSLGLSWIGSIVWAAIEIDSVNKGGRPIIEDFK